MAIKREALADIFALITFSLVTGLFIEIVVAGLSLEQSMISRLLSIPVNLMIARPYGLYRDWIMCKGKANRAGQLRLTLLDVIAYVTFQLPVYAGLVASAGASVDQIIVACAMQVGGFILLARPYGLYLQMCRNWMLRTSLHPV